MTFWCWRHAVLFSLILSLVAASACSSHEPPPPPADRDPLAVTLAPIIGTEVNTSTTLPSAAPSVLPEAVKAATVGVSGKTALVVWADGRSGVFGLFGARVDLDTKAVGKTIKIAVAPSPRPFSQDSRISETISDIRVTAGASSFLVTWYDYTDFFEHPYLFAVRVPVDGSGSNVVDPERISIGQLPVNQVQAFEASRRYGVSAGAGGFMVVYDQAKLGLYDVHGVFVDETAKPAVVSEFNLGSSSPKFQYPQVASDGSQFFAVWRRSVSGLPDTDIFGALFDKTGTKTGTPIRLSQQFNSRSVEHDLAFIPTPPTEQPSAPGSYLVSVPSDGDTLLLKVIGGNALTVPSAPKTWSGVEQPRILARTSDAVGIQNNCVYAITQGGVGAPSCTPITLDPGESLSSSAARGAGLVVATQIPSAGAISPRLRTVGAGGAVDVSRARGAQTNVAGAFSSTQTQANYLLAWRETTSGGNAVYGSCLSVDPNAPESTTKASPSTNLSSPINLPPGTELSFDDIRDVKVVRYSGPTSPSFALVFSGHAKSGEVGAFGSIVQCDPSGNVVASRPELVAPYAITAVQARQTSGLGIAESRGNIYIVYKGATNDLWNIPALHLTDSTVYAVRWTGKTAPSAPFGLSLNVNSPRFDAPSIVCDEANCLAVWAELQLNIPAIVGTYIKVGSAEVSGAPRTIYKSSKLSVGFGTSGASDGNGSFGIAFQQLGGDSLHTTAATVIIPSDPAKIDPSSEVVVKTDPLTLSMAQDEAASLSIGYFGDRASFFVAWTNRALNAAGYGVDNDIFGSVVAVDRRILVNAPLVVAAADGTPVGDTAVDEDRATVVAGLPSLALVAYTVLDMTEGVAARRIAYRFVKGEAVAGVKCSTPEECATRYCAQGACSFTSCNEGCGVNVNGVCVPLAAQTPCGRGLAFACDGAGTTCKSTCQSNADCSELSECRVDANGVSGCVSLRNVCLDDHTPVGIDEGKDCGAYRCRDGACLTRCESKDDCYGDNICGFNKICSPPPPIENGADCSMGRGRTTAPFIGISIALTALAFRRRGRKGGAR